MGEHGEETIQHYALGTELLRASRAYKPQEKYSYESKKNARRWLPRLAAGGCSSAARRRGFARVPMRARQHDSDRLCCVEYH